MRGRKPKPENLRRLSETTRIVGTGDAPDRPDELTEDQAAVWDWLVADLASRGLASQSDLLSLRKLCILYCRWLDVSRTLDEVGYTSPTEHGEKTHPLVRIESDLSNRVRLLFAEFGLTPAARSRLQVPPARGEDEDDFEKLMNDRGSPKSPDSHAV